MNIEWLAFRCNRSCIDLKEMMKYDERSEHSHDRYRYGWNTS